MLVPKLFLGTFPEVRRQTSRYLRSLAKGESMELELVDTQSDAGLIVVDDQEGFLAEERHYQMYAIFEVADSAQYRPMHPRIFNAVLAHHPWGPLALLGSLVSLLWIHRVIGRTGANSNGAAHRRASCGKHILRKSSRRARRRTRLA
jgi:hypothetical protein